MNNIEPIADPKIGILLTDTVDLEWLRSVTPRFYNDYIKFVVDFDTENVYVGMDIHADCVPGDIPGDERDRRFRGGNLYFKDGHIVYESTLNIQGNLSLPVTESKKGGIAGLLGSLFNRSKERVFDDIRIVADDETKARIDRVLYRWVRI